MTNLEKELEETRKELAEAIEQLKAQKAENERNKEKIKIHEFIFSNLGLSIDKINQLDDRIRTYRENHISELLSSNIDEQERSIVNMQDMASELALELICGNVGDNVEVSELNLKEKFGNVWDLLDENSKSFLISAKVTFGSMARTRKPDALDYSGVCLLVTKALELELFRVFFKEYIQYLRDKKIQINEYPKELLDKTGTTIKADHLFSLGMVIHIWGLKYGCKKSQILRENNPNYQLFLKYAQERLYGGSDIEIANEILKNACFIERTRVDYRNPSAHTGHLTRVVCQECLDYIVDIEKQMKRMLENMNKRNERIFI